MKDLLLYLEQNVKSEPLLTIGVEEKNKETETVELLNKKFLLLKQDNASTYSITTGTGQDQERGKNLPVILI